jgi:hypothetical protein
MHGNRGLTLPAAHHDVRSALPYLGATRTAQATKQLASVSCYATSDEQLRILGCSYSLGHGGEAAGSVEAAAVVTQSATLSAIPPKASPPPPGAPGSCCLTPPVDLARRYELVLRTEDVSKRGFCGLP